MKQLWELFLKSSPKAKKWIIGILVLIVLIICANISASRKAAEEEERKRIAEAEARALAMQGVSEEEIDYDDLLQQAYIEEWGLPPDGFKWAGDGSLIALSDNNTTAEDTSYYFLRGLSTLDFSTAEKYSKISIVSTQYNNYYGISSSENYYTQFLRKMYKQALLSIEINEVVDTAVFADGSRIVTFDINILDLTNKDFWLDDKAEIFDNLYEFNATESDGTKAQQYLYDYVLEYYQGESPAKRNVQIDLKLEKQTDGGWLVIDDTDLNMLCSYENGVNVTEHILSSYEVWVNTEKIEKIEVPFYESEDFQQEESTELTIDDVLEQQGGQQTQTQQEGQSTQNGAESSSGEIPVVNTDIPVVTPPSDVGGSDDLVDKPWG